MQPLGERLRWLRKFKGMTLEEFGRRAGMDKSYLSRLESGVVSNPSERLFTAICSQFWVNREWLATGHGEPFSGDGPRAIIIGSGGADVQISDERLGRVLAMLDDVYSVLRPDDFLADLLQGVTTAELRAAYNRVLNGQETYAIASTFWLHALHNVLLRRPLAEQTASGAASTDPQQPGSGPASAPQTGCGSAAEIGSAPSESGQKTGV